MAGKFPEGSLITEFLPANYSDVYTYQVKAEKLSADDVQVAFWTNSPKWVGVLFKIRNSLVKLVGLKGGGKDTKALEECIRNGGSHEMTSVAAKSQNETILKLDDSHLDAYISIYIENLESDKKRVSATTLVHFHNKLGYIYFFVIYPFHHIVVKQMLKRSVRIAMK